MKVIHLLGTVCASHLQPDSSAPDRSPWKRYRLNQLISCCQGKFLSRLISLRFFSVDRVDSGAVTNEFDEKLSSRMGRPGGVIIIFTFLPGKCADPLQFEMNSKEPERAGLMEKLKVAL
jgi:hypothetical protein